MTEKEINQVYNAFPPEGRDMPRDEFVKQVKELMDPTKAQQDLAAIQLIKANKAQIDKSIERGS